MHVTVMPVSAYMALAFVFGFIPNKLMMMMMKCYGHYINAPTRSKFPPSLLCSYVISACGVSVQFIDSMQQLHDRMIAQIRNSSEKTPKAGTRQANMCS